MKPPWLVSRRFDLGVFLVPAVMALALVPLGPWLAPDGTTPVPMWLVAVVLVDVAHVWTTIYRTYLDPAELRRRPTLYAGAPLVAYAVGLSLAFVSMEVFWTGLAYLAVWHFVRQQYGWVALYNRRDAGATRADRWIDTVAIYGSTVFPLLWWHAHLPRRFDWFMPGDFFGGVVSGALVSWLWPVYVGAFLVFVARQISRRVDGEPWRWGKIVVVATTALCWGIGIIATNTDWAFTVTNVLIHGVPYFGIVWVYGRRSADRHPPGSVLSFFFRSGGLVPFYLLVALLAYVEELGWDRLVWHEYDFLFPGGTVDLGELGLMLVVPLLAVPQVTHYILDGFIWRTRRDKNPALAPAILAADT